MIHTVRPILIAAHPMRSASMVAMSLPDPRDVFADLRTAPAGTPVGISLTVVHMSGTMIATSSPGLLMSRGPDREPGSVRAADVVGNPELADAIALALHVSHGIQDLEIDPYRIGWEESSGDLGYHMRELWILPRVALLMANIHSLVADEAHQLAHQAVVLHEEAASNHARLDMAGRIDRLLALAATRALPGQVEMWPEDLPEGRIPFAPVPPQRLGSG